MKLAIAASALEYDAKLANFSYTCKGNNTFTLDAEEKKRFLFTAQVEMYMEL